MLDVHRKVCVERAARRGKDRRPVRNRHRSMLPNTAIVLKRFYKYEALGAAQDLLEALVRRERRRRGK